LGHRLCALLLSRGVHPRRQLRHLDQPDFGWRQQHWRRRRQTPGACVIDASSTRTGTQFQVNLNSGCTTASEETFEAAASYWADFLYSPVKIEIDADFAPMSCTATGGILGGAGPTTYAAGAALPEADTLYSIAHANALYGEDLYPDGPEMVMSFNSNIGTAGCIENYAWYFDDGTSPTTPAGTIDLYGTALHEIGHGLGFLSLLGSDGSQALAGYSDVYTNRLYSETMGLLTGLSDANRQSAITSETDLTWAGGAVDGLASTLMQGTTGGNVRMYAPNPYESGSSVSHFDKSLTPNDLMEPVKTTRETTEGPDDAQPVSRYWLGNHSRRTCHRLGQCGVRLHRRDAHPALPPR
jgi:hypothetical protein